jgi:pyrroline-5-carboxylate reductase
MVGCGNMGGALLDRWLSSGLLPERVTIIDPAASDRPGVRRVEGVAQAGEQPRVVVLAVKPQLLDAVADDISAHLAADTLLVSILAGTTADTLRRRFDASILRAMPNTPARIGKGATVLFGDVPPVDRSIVECLMASVGSVHWLEDEALFDAVTGVSGSGPAYLFRFIEAFGQAAAAAGLPPELAADLALETVTGAAALAAQRSATPAELRVQVTSPKGTTEAGLAKLDGNGQLTELLTATVAAAAARAAELARAAAQRSED